MAGSGDDIEQEVEAQIAQWRAYLGARQSIQEADLAELEDHLRGQIGELAEAGLAQDEAFLVAIKRLGEQDALSREFALEHTGRLWKQLVLSGSPAQDERDGPPELVVVLGLAVAAAVSFKFWDLAGIFPLDASPWFYARNFSLFVFPWLCVYFYWKRPSNELLPVWKLALPLVAAALLINSYPFLPDSDTLVLAILHLPIALWLVVGHAYAGMRWHTESGRMDFVRFTGELAIYYVLIALGGWVFIGVSFVLFASIGMDVEPMIESWILPCGVTGAVIVAAWLVEAKQGVIENIAPVLTHVFTPLFTLLLAFFLLTMLFTGQGISMDRDVLIAYDFLLALVLGLLLYSMTARDPLSPPGLFDYLQLALVVSALLADLIALAAIAGRISEYGFSANRLAALGENLVLLVNLGWSVWLYSRFIKGRAAFDDLVRWQMAYLPVYALWAALVVAIFPPLFAFR